MRITYTLRLLGACRVAATEGEGEAEAEVEAEVVGSAIAGIESRKWS